MLAPGPKCLFCPNQNKILSINVYLFIKSSMPRTIDIVNKIQLYVLSSEVFLTSGSLALYERCFSLWKEVWLPTLKELDGIQTLYSDGFTRQDFICALEVQGQLVGLCCFKRMNLKLVTHREDSWFAPWPQPILRELAAEYANALVPSWLTVSADFRRSAGYQGINVALILSELIGLNCLELNMDIAFGTPRKDRSVNRLVSQAGAQCLLSDVIHHGVPVDLVAFYPEKLRDHQFSVEAQIIWKNRSDLRYQPIQKDHFYENAI